MAATAQPTDATPEPATPTAAKPTAAKPDAKKDGTRETVESIVIAFIFAFLFRTFEAEAFVIPTGSMAPTLLGRHKDAHCPQCGFEYPVGASEELDRDTGTSLENRLNTTICPNCRVRFDVRNDPVFAGDRLLVTKFTDEIGEPHRFDITVFKFPENPTTNYIKRLCGLPGETIEIRQGDLYRVNGGQVEPLRKLSGDKQRAVLQPVYDDDHPAAALHAAGWPERWNPAAQEPEAGPGWTADRTTRTYTVAAAEQARWLRYRHFAPTRAVWNDVQAGRPLIDPRPRLVLDFSAYNALTMDFNNHQLDEGRYWVGDLALSATVNIAEVRPDAALTLELVEGSRRYRCTINPTTGKAALSYVDALDRDQRDAAARVLSEADCGIDGPGDYELIFANMDDQLWLWVDGDPIAFPTATYEPFGGQLAQLPTAADLEPAGIAATNLTATAAHLRIERDIYYRAEVLDPQSAWRRDLDSFREVGSGQNEFQLPEYADNPEAFAEFYRAHTPWLGGEGNLDRAKFELGPDEFLMLGDNSARSQDSRLWSNTRGDLHRHAVPRSALVGKALLIFWPHGLRWGNEQDGVAHGWTIPFLDRFFYHQRAVPPQRPNGPVQFQIVKDYPAHGVPFYPDFHRLLRRVR